jgi:DnaJ family protein C protein 2
MKRIEQPIYKFVHDYRWTVMLESELKELEKSDKEKYKYWDNFESWREFAQYDQSKPEEAQDRYERRYMENENKKIRAK